MPLREVSVVVLDLDNTLWDWVEIWHRSFVAMLDEIVRISGIPAEELYPEISKVHQRHGTSEYSFLIEELEPLREKHPGGNLSELYAPAIKAYRKARAATLHLYPTAFETLWAFREAGCLVVGYTESLAFYSSYRLRKTCLDGVIDFLYSPADHDVPKGMSLEQLRSFPADHYRLRKTVHRHTPPGEMKPNPEVLKSILTDIGAEPEQAIFIGDSRMKDIAMAQDCGVLDVWAEYGTAQDTEAYSLLKKVTHWTPEDVAREAEINARGSVVPTHVLDHSLSQVLTKFSFVRFARLSGASAGNPPISHLPPRSPTPGVPAPSDAEIEIWKKTVDVQQHFNDLGLRIRNFAVTILAAALGAAAIVFREGYVLTIGNTTVPLAAFVLVGAIIAWSAFWFMDQLWYHRLLYGSVIHGLALEAHLKGTYPQIGLTKAIGDASPFVIGRWKVRSAQKFWFFYGSVLLILVVLVAASIIATPRPLSPASAAGAGASPSAMEGEGARAGETAAAPAAASLPAASPARAPDTTESAEPQPRSAPRSPPTPSPRD